MPRGREAPRAPKGLHPTDKIPIWAAKDEFMIRARSALMYGHDILDKINRGLVDPLALRALASTGKTISRVSSIPRKGLASGGPVLSSTTQSIGAIESQRQGNGGQQPVPAYIVADEAAVDILLKGGGRRFIRYMDENGFRRA